MPHASGSMKPKCGRPVAVPHEVVSFMGGGEAAATDVRRLVVNGVSLRFRAGEVVALTRQSARFNVGTTTARRPAPKASAPVQRAMPAAVVASRAEPEWASF